MFILKFFFFSLPSVLDPHFGTKRVNLLTLSTISSAISMGLFHLHCILRAMLVWGECWLQAANPILLQRSQQRALPDFSQCWIASKESEGSREYTCYHYSCWLCKQCSLVTENMWLFSYNFKGEKTFTKKIIITAHCSFFQLLCM